MAAVFFDRYLFPEYPSTLGDKLRTAQRLFGAPSFLDFKALLEESPGNLFPQRIP